LDPWSSCITKIGVTCDPRRSARETDLDPALDHHGLSPPDRAGAFWSMTKAPLEGLVEVRICRDKDRSHEPCIGLLLYYENQSVERITLKMFKAQHHQTWIREKTDGRRYQHVGLSLGGSVELVTGLWCTVNSCAGGKQCDCSCSPRYRKEFDVASVSQVPRR